MSLCECGCGDEASPGKTWLKGHNKRGKPYYERQARSGLCECGCGGTTEYRFVAGHHAKWAAGMLTPEERRARRAEYNRRRYAEQRDERRAKAAEYYRENAERLRAAAAKRRREIPYDPEANARRSRDYYERKKAQDPTYYAERRALRRAREASAKDGELDYAAILEEHGRTCHICSEEIPEGQLEFDHVVPLIRGGAHSASNVRPSHTFRNRSKGTRLIEEMAA